MTETDGESVDLEKTLDELERLVEQLEQGDLALETSLQLFEHGVRLTRRCQTALRDAEQRVEKLLESNGQQTIVAFEQTPGEQDEEDRGNNN